MSIDYKAELEAIYHGTLCTNTRFEDDLNGPYREYCPFCGDYIAYRGNESTPTMRDIDHYDGCQYLKARRYFYPEYFL